MNLLKAIFLLFFSLTDVKIGTGSANWSTPQNFTINDPNNEWHLTKEKNNIKVYTRKSKSSAIKEIRIKTTMKTSLEELTAYLGDVPKYTKWVYKCSQSKRIKTNSPQDFYYHTTTDMPFPLTDRDLVVHSTQYIDQETGIYYSHSVAAPKEVPVKRGVVRITTFESNWKITPLSNGTVAIDYTALADPAGYLPAWMVNLGVSTGPFITMQQLVAAVEN